jgi:hypothetical protein
MLYLQRHKKDDEEARYPSSERECLGCAVVIVEVTRDGVFRNILFPSVVLGI